MVSCIVNSTVTLRIDHGWISTVVQQMLQAAGTERQRQQQQQQRLLVTPQWAQSQHTRQELTSKTPWPPPRCCHGSQKNDDRLWESKRNKLPLRWCWLDLAGPWRPGCSRCVQRRVRKPAEGLGGGSVVQGSTADLVGLVDLSASAHQGHGALVPPVSSRIVQWCPARSSAVATGEQETANVKLGLVDQTKRCQTGS